MCQTGRINDRARAAAAATGKDVYQHQVIDHWPACTTCGQIIRRNVDGPGIGAYRSCDCPGGLWRSADVVGGWERVPVDQHGHPSPTTGSYSTPHGGGTGRG